MSNLILCGFKGAGKTTLGLQLSGLFDKPFVDTDHLIEASAGRSVKAIFAEDRGLTFRRLEKNIIESLKSVKGHIIALGGGSLCDEENQKIVQTLGLVVYLKVSPQLLQKRTTYFPFENFDITYTKRCAIFEQIADITWELDNG